jgi:hypothetical protein
VGAASEQTQARAERGVHELRQRLAGWHFSQESLPAGEREILHVGEMVLRIGEMVLRRFDALLADLAAAEERAERLQQAQEDALVWDKALRKSCADTVAAEARAERLQQAITQARKALWWFIEGDGDIDRDDAAAEAIRIQDEILRDALAVVEGEQP